MNQKLRVVALALLVLTGCEDEEPRCAPTMIHLGPHLCQQRGGGPRHGPAGDPDQGVIFNPDAGVTK